MTAYLPLSLGVVTSLKLFIDSLICSMLRQSATSIPADRFISKSITKATSPSCSHFLLSMTSNASLSYDFLCFSSTNAYTRGAVTIPLKNNQILWNYLFDIIISWFTKLFWILSIVKNVVMHLESNTEMGSKIKKLFLSFNVEPIYYPETSTPQGDHRSCFIICLSYIGVEIVV